MFIDMGGLWVLRLPHRFKFLLWQTLGWPMVKFFRSPEDDEDYARRMNRLRRATSFDVVMHSTDEGRGQ